MNKRVIIGGGGTGGHIFPAISIANALRKADPGISILFVGAMDKIEMVKVPEAGYKIIGLPVNGFQRKISLRIFIFLFKLLKSMYLSKKIIKDFNPDVAVGVGGYASGPILRAASVKNIPIVLQEQNSYAGYTNRILSKSAVKICVAYAEMEKFFPAHKIILTGNPVRQEIAYMKTSPKEGKTYFGLSDNKETILVLGGSLGAKTINESVWNNIANIPENIQIIWQTGSEFFQKAESTKSKLKSGSIYVTDFIARMDMAYTVADLIISRAGAVTISELSIVGKPVILVPSPNVAEDHQTLNALSLVKQNAAILIRDNEAKAKLMQEAYTLINDRNKRNLLSRNLKTLAIPDSAERIAKEILELIKQ